MISSLFKRNHSTTPDLLIIGGGPGGYVSAIRAAQLGLQTVCVEKENLLGGTCLREGCIPSKFLLNVAHKFYETNHGLKQLGIKLSSPAKVDISTVQKQKDLVVTTNAKGIELLFSKYGATLEKGLAKIVDSKTILVQRNDGTSVEYHPKKIILATGSEVSSIPDYPIDEKLIVSSRGALQFTEVPKSLFVIGPGVIGLEVGSIWNSLGSKVTIFGRSPYIGGQSVDKDSSKVLMSVLRRHGIDFILGKYKTTLKKNDNSVDVTVGDKHFTVDRVLVAIGRRPYLKGFGFENLNLQMTKNGFIQTNERFETSIPNIYAIGDITLGPQLAHKAEEEGIQCVEMIAGKRKSSETEPIPSVIYTSPELAAVGLNEEEAKKKGIKVKIGKFQYRANSRARATFDVDGFVKWVCDQKGNVLGLNIVGPNAGEAIMEGTIAIKNKLNIKDIAETCHPHPTLSEALMEAAKAVLDKPIHS
ncbi:dihydrolipoyl dehydrogenase [Histomonas meleagridis]|uniref:dihydrolipoyl dehydrogenase n=1 Tax=Histomonas meleagridis TaxID=135588 RepID=UPI00355A24D3|nr:dihydrolipoyl dehydrogenase [Histomonas meleagridis]KAH0802463.1 dihydrolipoyl dehydrogenase [Histomonas meleagridis]